MVRQCPCKHRRCSCAVDGETGITITGNGGGRQPYIPHWAQWALVGDDSSQVSVEITGSGTSGDPWVVTMDTQGGSVEQTIYTADGTWVKPQGTFAQVVVIGGGGGGGSAGGGANAGGSGGSGGVMSTAWFSLDDLPDEVDIRVGQGGDGAPPIVGQTTAGDGGDSWFGEYLYAPGGKGGKSQANPSQTQYETVGGTAPDGGPGGAGAVRNGSSVVQAPDHLTLTSPTGGGMGEGALVANSDGGSMLLGESWAGQGGDGGDNDLPASGRSGQPGGLYGGGGGGGASGPTISYDGGDGGPGVVVVTVW